MILFVQHKSAPPKCGALFFYKYESGTQEMTMNELHSRGKIVQRTKGIGTVTPQMIEERAHEIARSDGRAQPNDLGLDYCARATERCCVRLRKTPDEAGTGSRLANTTCIDG